MTLTFICNISLAGERSRGVSGGSNIEKASLIAAAGERQMTRPRQTDERCRQNSVFASGVIEYVIVVDLD